LARAWFEGLAASAKDAATVSRRLAGKDRVPLAAGVGGAPEAIVLLERMGQLEAATLAEQASLFGKGPASLEELTARTWQLARAGGLTTGGAPEPSPLEPRVVRALGLTPAPSTAPAGDLDAGIALGSPPRNATPLLVYRVDEGSADPAQ